MSTSTEAGPLPYCIPDGAGWCDGHHHRLSVCIAEAAEARAALLAELEAGLGPFAANLPQLRRIAREAQDTYVGRNWPTTTSMRRDGIGFGLVEDAAHERLIRRYLDTFQPEFVVDLLDRLAAVLDLFRKAGG